MPETSEPDPDSLAAATLDELISDAGTAGLPDFSERLARDWHRRGLLGSPSRQSLGRGRGSEPGVYSSQQRALFQAIARHRAAGRKLATLATLPVWTWLTYGEDWVDLSQLRRALATVVGNPRLSQRVAGQTAQLLLRVVDHKQGRPGDRGRLRDELIDQLQHNRIDENRLLPRVEAVFGPSPLTVRGPVGASMTARDFTYILGMRALAAASLKKISDEQLLTARRQHLATWPTYQQHRAELATQAGSLASLFAGRDISEEVISSVPTVLLLVGMQLHAARVAAKRSAS